MGSRGSGYEAPNYVSDAKNLNRYINTINTGETFELNRNEISDNIRKVLEANLKNGTLQEVYHSTNMSGYEKTNGAYHYVNGEVIIDKATTEKINGQTVIFEPRSTEKYGWLAKSPEIIERDGKTYYVQYSPTGNTYTEVPKGTKVSQVSRVGGFVIGINNI